MKQVRVGDTIEKYRYNFTVLITNRLQKVVSRHRKRYSAHAHY